MSEIPEDAVASTDDDTSPVVDFETAMEGQVVAVSWYPEGREVVLQLGQAPSAMSVRLTPEETRRLSGLLADAADEFGSR